MFYDIDKNEQERLNKIDDFIKKSIDPKSQEEVVIKNNDYEVTRKEISDQFMIDFTKNNLLIDIKTSINDKY